MSDYENSPRAQYRQLGVRPNVADHFSTLHRQSRARHGAEPLTSSPLFAAVPEDDHARILASARTREFARNDVMYLEGESVEEVVMLTSGYVKLSKFGGSGTVTILGLGAPGDVLGAANLLFTGRHSTTAQPVGLCRGLVWRASAFKTLVEQSPTLCQNTIRTHAEYLKDLEERFCEVTTMLVGQRVARQLVRLHERMFRSVNHAGAICLSHEELAQMTGTNLFSVSRLLSDWEGRGIVESRRQAVTVRDVEALRAISGCT